MKRAVVVFSGGQDSTIVWRKRGISMMKCIVSRLIMVSATAQRLMSRAHWR
ncbi:Uncharacterised protein [Salmonella enterica subsp. enterica]|uniref:Queuosine biosynthesis protein QueC n=1 Tax=Salmonella enterica I TaxID=59201 RepID=A0A379WDF7_SALET|nr:Uncharacterised protein [Salmonella enterica subsp. enterica]